MAEEDLTLIAGTKISLIAVSKLDIKNRQSFLDRLVRKIGETLTANFGIQTIWSLGYGSWRYTPTAITQNADIYIAHQELGLFCGVELLKVGKKVAFDFEDWYSEDLQDQHEKHGPFGS